MVTPKSDSHGWEIHGWLGLARLPIVLQIGRAQKGLAMACRNIPILPSGKHTKNYGKSPCY